MRLERRLIAALLAVAPAVAAAQRVDRAEHHEFVIADFKTESGVVLPKAIVVYGTYGHLNAARDNAILLPSHYMATHHGYEWLIGPGRALDTATMFLVATELFGNGHSSSPSNTPEPYHGPRFPVTTIRDNVDAVHRLLVEDLKITHLRAIIGFSMGAEQAFQWAVSYPTFADRIVATSGTAKAYGHGIVRLEGQIAALTTDPTFNGGNYTTPPKRGMEALGMGWAGCTRRSGGVASCGRGTLRRERRSSSTCRPSARTSFPPPTRTTSFSRRAPGNGTTWARRPASTATSSAHCGRSRFRCSTCRR